MARNLVIVFSFDRPRIFSEGFLMKWPIPPTTASALARHCRALIRSCAHRSDIDAGEKLHAAAVTSGLLVLPQLFVGNLVMQMYAACGDVLSARKVFDEIPPTYTDAADWTTLMDCHSSGGAEIEALRLFVLMRNDLVPVDDVVMVSLFGTCAKVGNSVFGIQGHGCMIKMGLGFLVKARNAAMDMYVKCALMDDAKKVFDEMSDRNVVSWTVLLWGVMKWEGLEKGKKLFDEMPERNVIAWTVMVSRHVENGLTREAFKLLTEMVFDYGLCLDSSSSLRSILSACTQSGDVVIGKWLHSYALKSTMDASKDVKFCTALLDMYAKCGQINSAIRVFESMEMKNVITWNAMLAGLAMHGKGALVLETFDQMLDENIKPNDVTFTALLSACSHSGLVDEGRRLFHALETTYSITPSMENYASMVDLLGRSGYLQEAEAIIRSMPMKPNEVVLGSLLAACSSHKAHEMGERLVKDLNRLFPHNTDHHILVSNMYAFSGKKAKADSLRKDLRERGIKKRPGTSTMYVNGEIHQFTAGERSHPRINEVYSKLDEMIGRLKACGYVPDTSSQILGGDEEEEEKERAVLSHSEKLAVCFGLISTKPGTPICIFKNLRICRDCHGAMKMASKIYDREISIRDRNRFHLFKNGACSCSDYW